MSDTAPPRPSTARVWTVLGALYFVWGTTYLGIEKVNETAPTLLGAATRFLFAGTVLFLWASSRTSERPQRPQWRAAAIVGVFLLLGGNALVAVSENMGTPTGVVALIIALIPLWLSLFDRVLLRSAPLGWKVLVGLVGGFVGAAVLVGTSATIGHVPLGGMLVAVGATLCWTAGSLYARGASLPKAPLLGSGMQQMVGGLVILTVAVAAGELRGFSVSQVSAASWLGLLWLIVAGSFVGFSAYLWLLRNVRTSLVATYAYVNPVVAVTLGWLVLDEPVTGRLLVAAVIILGSVALIVSAGGTAQREEAHDTPVSELPAGTAMAEGSPDERGAEIEREV